VPFFRAEDHGLLERPFLLSIITSPAPNVGEAVRKGVGEERQVESTLKRRAGKILALAARRQHRCLVLGAWGCGVFRNDPEVVAGAFSPVEELGSSFDPVVFAVYDRSKEQPNLRAFRRRFG
jgi:uncharacterized protein (TIGR02452 family)